MCGGNVGKGSGGKTGRAAWISADMKAEGKARGKGHDAGKTSLEC